MAKKKYVISTYCSSFAMYESDDFRLKDEPLQLKGTFKRDDSVKGTFNGREIGLFHCDNGEKYLVFTDHSARKYEQNNKA